MFRLIPIFLALSCFSCATTRVPYGKLSQNLNIGMTKAEVKQILGEPRTTSMEVVGNDNVETWSYYPVMIYGFTPIDNPHLAPAGDRLNVGFQKDQLFYWGDPLNFTEQMRRAFQNIPEMKIHQTIDNK